MLAKSEIWMHVLWQANALKRHQGKNQPNKEASEKRAFHSMD